MCIRDSPDAADHVLGQQQLAHLGAALDDLHQLRVPEGPRHHVPVLGPRGRQHLHRRGRALGRPARALVLRQQRGDHRLRRPAVPAPAGVLAQPGRHLLAGDQGREVPGHELVLRQRSAELLARRGVPRGGVPARAQDADAAPRHRLAPVRQRRGHQQPESGARPEHRRRGYAHRVEDHGGVPGGAAAQRVRDPLDPHARRAHGHHDHGAAALGVPAEHDQQVRVVGGRDPHLVPVDHDRVAVGAHGGGHRHQVAARVRLAEPDRGQLAAGEPAQVLAALGRSGQPLHGPRRHALRRLHAAQRAAQRARGGGELAVVQARPTEAAVLDGHLGAQQAVGAEAAQQVRRQQPRPVPRARSVTDQLRQLGRPLGGGSGHRGRHAHALPSSPSVVRAARGRRGSGEHRVPVTSRSWASRSAATGSPGGRCAPSRGRWPARAPAAGRAGVRRRCAG